MDEMDKNGLREFKILENQTQYNYANPALQILGNMDSWFSWFPWFSWFSWFSRFSRFSWTTLFLGTFFRKSLTHFYKKKPPPMIYIVGKLWISAFADLRAKQAFQGFPAPELCGANKWDGLDGWISVWGDSMSTALRC